MRVERPGERELGGKHETDAKEQEAILAEIHLMGEELREGLRQLNAIGPRSEKNYDAWELLRTRQNRNACGKRSSACAESCKSGWSGLSWRRGVANTSAEHFPPSPSLRISPKQLHYASLFSGRLEKLNKRSLTPGLLPGESVSSHGKQYGVARRLAAGQFV